MTLCFAFLVFWEHFNILTVKKITSLFKRRISKQEEQRIKRKVTFLCFYFFFFFL